MSRVIFINRYFHPDTSATSQMLSDLAFALAETQPGITVITSSQLYDAPDVRLAAHEVVSGVDIHRLATTRFGRHNLIGRALDYLTFYISAAIALWRLAGRGDVIVAKTDPPVISILAAPIAWLKGATLVNWLQDVFPEVAGALGVGGGATGPAFALLRTLRNRSLKAAAANVVLGERMKGLIAQTGVEPQRIRVIANWADGKLVAPIPPGSNALRKDWGLQDKFVVGYSGNLGRAHETATMLEAMSILEAPQPPKAAFVFLGGGALMPELKRGIKERHLQSVHFKPYQPRERLSESLSVADVHLVSLLPELEGLIVPSKIYGIAAAGRPAINIGDKDGEVARLLRTYDFGVTVAPGDGRGLAEIISQLAADHDVCQRFGANARAAFDTAFDKSFAVASWRDLLSGLNVPPAT